ncbi:SusC/RagA family TonB-linked outer membrane protein [Mucilaginibacter ginkgonis]|uniref:TonB-dependent receptor n=1 Tax=Mucilaginibacter ginkgonis TaxID=2682091 RepID=A0A6I4I5L2_9SPHI|nr:TonB-dependent receptor [Mucilaginibacter ginkgonis]QQL49088.1 TonB-dependent receptor [Mucilaginibacter ginkgonis]
MKKFLLFLFSLSLFVQLTAFGQTRRISGRVTSADDGQSLPGVTVKVAGSNTGVQTDADGYYTLNLNGGTTITFSFIGFVTQTVKVGAANAYNVKLSSDLKQLNEVVVVGYGSESKRTTTGAIASVRSKDIQDRPVTGVDQALQGLTAGVTVTSASGTPGGAVTVRVRGVSTINAGSQPLYVVDGTPIQTGSNSQLGFGNGVTNALNDINPNDIESMDVLKDAAAAAIYGSRASNGVIIITTKRGKVGRTNVDVDYYTGFQQTVKKIPALTGPQYVQLFQEAVTNRYSTLIGTATYPTLAALITNGLGRGNLANDPSTYQTTNWQDQVFRNAPISNYNISVNGGNEKTRFNLTSGYFDQKGIVRGSDYGRFNLRLNLDHSISDKIKVGTSTGYSRSTSNRINNDNNIYGVLSTAILMSPTIPIYNADGTYGKDVYSSVENPVAAYKEPFNLNTAGRLLSNVYGEYKVLPYLTFKTNFAADYQITHERRFLPSTTNAGGGSTNGSGAETYYSDLNLLNENTLNFSKTIGDHSFNVLVGQSWQKDNYETVDAEGTNFPGNGIQRLSAAAVKTVATSGGSSSTLVSFFGRANYNYKQRYILSATLRSDGSSRFADGHRYGYFPAFSGAWVISDEAFMKGIQPVLSTLKLRGSWGKTGNNFVSDFASRTLIGSGFNYNQVAGLAPSQLGDANLTWEKTTSTDLALDFGFLQDRITVSIDAYYRKTNDLLASLPLAAQTGFTGYTTNVGSLQNKGIEIDLTSVNIRKKDFTWTTNFNIAFNRNKILSLANNNTPYASGFASWVEVGSSVGAFRGYQVAGIFQSQAEIDALNAAAKTATGSSTATYQVATTAPGDIKFADLNGDGVVTSADQKILGTSQPQFTGGLNNSLRYKWLDLSFLWQFSYGNKIYNNTRSFAEGMNTIYGQFASTLNRWTPTNTNTDMPRAVYGDPNTNTRVSDRFLENGSYLRLKNVNLGFNLPQSVSDKLHVRKVRIFAAAQNLATITKYKGFDPEVSTFNSTPTSQGTDFLTVPQAKSFTFGVNLGL